MVLTMKLTARFVETCVQKGRFADGGGLYLQIVPVQGSGRASKRKVDARQPRRRVEVTRQWLFRYQLAGKARAMGLGSTSTFTLAEAREAARRARQLLHQGIDPLNHRRDAVAAKAAAELKRATFQQVAEAYVAARGKGAATDGTKKKGIKKWTAQHGRVWRNSLETYVYPTLGDLPVDAIDSTLVLKVLEPHWHEKADTMMKVRGRISEVLDSAKARHLRPANSDNPARWKGFLDKILPSPDSPVHLAAMDYRKVPAFMSALAGNGAIAARALAFTVLTAARSGEVLGAHWAEIDRGAKTWTVPPSRMKSGRQHVVPLSDAALAILDAMPRLVDDDLVFPGSRPRRPLGHMRMREVLQSMPGCAGLTVHGFRSAFRDFAGDQTLFPREVAEAALAHAVGDAVERSYRRGDALAKRAELMVAWAAFCGGERGDNVVELESRRREATA
jgi:integrase